MLPEQTFKLSKGENCFDLKQIKIDWRKSKKDLVNEGELSCTKNDLFSYKTFMNISLKLTIEAYICYLGSSLDHWIESCCNHILSSRSCSHISHHCNIFLQNWDLCMRHGNPPRHAHFSKERRGVTFGRLQRTLVFLYTPQI